MASPEQFEDPDLLPDLFGEARWRRLVRRLSLTRRQAEVARLICRGCENRQMAARLGVSVDTIRLHAKKLLKQLRARNRVGVLVRLLLAEKTPRPKISGRAIRGARTPRGI
ncbi:MAG TPA: helix-turn-helix transcriptional regulator [Phycisphaerae bacterium]|nr:helix-turn-helix transcriptional regulator [Phycisphaerae bacterium]